MAGAELIGVTAVTGTVVLLVVAHVLTGWNWRKPEPRNSGGRSDGGYSESTDGAEFGWVRDLVSDPAAWSVAFVASAAIAGFAVISMVRADASFGSLPGAVVAGSFALLLSVFLLVGTFVSVRGRGYDNAVAALVSTWALGGALVLSIAVKLLFTGP